MEEARLYYNKNGIHDTLCLIGGNDSISEITINENGTMNVKFIRSTKVGDGEWVDVEHNYKGITKISFK